MIQNRFDINASGIVAKPDFSLLQNHIFDPTTAQLLCLRAEEDGDRGLPLRGPEAELLLYGPVV